MTLAQAAGSQSATTLELVTLGIAILGAVTGVLALIASMVQFSLSGGRAAVFLNMDDVGPLWLEVANVGRIPVFAAEVGLGSRHPAHRRRLSIESLGVSSAAGPHLPCKIDPGDSVKWAVPKAPVVAASPIRRSYMGSPVRGYVALATGKRHWQRGGRLVSVKRGGKIVQAP